MSYPSDLDNLASVNPGDLIDAALENAQSTAIEAIEAELGTHPSGAYPTVAAAVAGKLDTTGGTMSGNIAMGTNKVTGLGDPSAQTDGVNAQTVQKGALSYAPDTGSANAYAVALTPAPAAYVAGMVVNFKATNANTGASTINVNSIGVVSIKKGTADLASGDVTADQIVHVVYDGTNFQMAGVGGVPPGYSGQSTIATVGTITSGTWNGSTIDVAHGGTGGSTASGARTNLGAAASGANSDITALSGLSTALSIAQGGTGAVAAAAAFNALSPLTTTGDLIYGGAAGAGTRLGGNTSTTRKFLREVGDGVNANAPAWDTLVANDVPKTLDHTWISDFDARVYEDMLAPAALTVTQTSHGLAVGNPVKCTGSLTFAAAKADSASNAERIAVVSEVADANNYTLLPIGQVVTLTTGQWDTVAGTSGGLSAGTQYYLSAGTAGVITATAPTGSTQYNVPILVAISSTKAILLPYRPDSAVSNVAAPAPPVGFRSASNVTTPNTKVDYSCRYATLVGTNDFKAFSNFSGTIDTSGTGANGLDTGTQASNTLYYLWLIGKADGTTSAVLSTSSTAPTMPSGYAYKFLVGWAVSNGSTQFLRFHQDGNILSYEDLYGEAQFVNATMVTGPTTYNLTSILSYPLVAPALCRRVYLMAQGQASGMHVEFYAADNIAGTSDVVYWCNNGVYNMFGWVRLDSTGNFKSHCSLAAGNTMQLRLPACQIDWY